MHNTTVLASSTASTHTTTLARVRPGSLEADQTNPHTHKIEYTLEYKSKYPYYAHERTSLHDDLVRTKQD